jgi:hypothetical protein
VVAVGPRTSPFSRVSSRLMPNLDHPHSSVSMGNLDVELYVPSMLRHNISNIRRVQEART